MKNMRVNNAEKSSFFKKEASPSSPAEELFEDILILRGQ